MSSQENNTEPQESKPVFEERIEVFKKRANGVILSNFKFILTAVLMIALTFVSFMEYAQAEGLSQDTLITFIIGLGIHIVVMSIWIPGGKDKGEKNLTVMSNKKEAGTLINKILNDPKRTEELPIFCDCATDENRTAKKKSILSKHKLRYEDYQIRFESKTKAEIKKNVTLTWQQKRTVLRINKGVKVKPINPTSITCLSNTTQETYSVSNPEGAAGIRHISAKLISNMLITAALAYITFSPSDGSIAAALTRLALWFASILSNAILCDMLGFKLVFVYRNKYYRNLINFCSRFESWRQQNKDDSNSK